MKNKILTQRKRTSVLIFLMSLIVAFFCDMKAFNAYLTAGINIDENQGGPMAMLYFLSVLCVFFLGLINKRGAILNDISGSKLFLIIWIVLFYFFTYGLIAPPYTSVLFFGVFTLISFLIPSVAQIEPKYYLKAMMFIATPTIFRIDNVFNLYYEYDETISMGLSYSYLTPVVATIVYVFVYFKKETIWQRCLTLLGIAINLVFAYYLVSYGSRGPVLALLILIMFLVLIKPKKTGIGLMIEKGRSFFISLLILIVILSFIPLLELLHKVLSEYGLSFNFVEKILLLDQMDDVANGRTVLMKLAIDDILSNPLFGMGLDQFDNQHHMLYPHNFIVQIFYDGGVLFFIILFVPLYRGIKRLTRNCTMGEYAVFTTLLFGSVPGAMFSGDFWQNGMLWMLFGFILSNNFVQDIKVLK